jgi:Leucine-rich repeat (LRR) protein
MRDTQRTLNNIPGSMDSLTNLTELDLAQNALPKVPDALYSLRNLRRLNLSNNEITELSQAIGKYHSYRDKLNLFTCMPIIEIIKKSYALHQNIVEIMPIIFSMCICPDVTSADFLA